MKSVFEKIWDSHTVEELPGHNYLIFMDQIVAHEITTPQGAIEIDEKFYPIEIKTATTVSGHDLRGIRAFKETYPHLNIQTGIVIYAGDLCHRVAEDIIAVPWNSH